jgi:hypothetical protein
MVSSSLYFVVIFETNSRAIPAKRLQLVAHVCIQKIKGVRSSEKLVSFCQAKGFNMIRYDMI